MKRQCMICCVPIDACMGFVIARDWLKALAGEIAPEATRELCGKCVFRAEASSAEFGELACR